MPSKKKAGASVNLSRLKVLAAGDEAPFREHIIELLASGDRLAREAALEAEADDFLTKPVSIAVIAARLRVMILIPPVIWVCYAGGLLFVGVIVAFILSNSISLRMPDTLIGAARRNTPRLRVSRK